MKKKLIPLILVLVCAFTCAFGLVGCGDGNNGDNGECRHNFIQTTFHIATCTEGSYYDEQCTKCGETRKGSEQNPPTEHGRGNAQYNNDETCTKNGTESWECPMCHETLSREVLNSAKHIFNGSRDCERCDAQIENKYLKYELNTTGDGYVVDIKDYSNEWTEASEDLKIVNIPAEYNGLPVVEIKKGGISRTHIVYIPSTVKIIGERAFSGTELRKVIFEDDSRLETIGVFAFEYTHITELTLPDGITSIGSSSLAHMYFLTCLTLPESVTEMQDSCLTDDIRLNTIINNSDFAITNEKIRRYVGKHFLLLHEVNEHFAVRESNPNYLASKTYTQYDGFKDVDVIVYYSYLNLDGENILTGMFADNYGRILDKIEVPYGITQIDSTALFNFDSYSLSASELALPNSLKKINKVNDKLYVYNNIYIRDWGKIDISEYTDLSDFEEDDFSDSNGVNHLETYKDENPAYYTLDFNFYDSWNTVKANNYTYEEGGITITFSTSSGDMTGVGERSSASLYEPACVGFNIANLVITISIDDQDVRVAQAIALSGHNSSARPGYGVKVNGFYYDPEEESYVRGHAEMSFNTSNYAYSTIDFDTAKSFGKGDWKYELSDPGVYGFRLLSLKITLGILFNADLTAKTSA